MIGTLTVRISDDKTQAYLTLARPAGAPAGARNDYAELVHELTTVHGLTNLDEDALAKVIDDFNDREMGSKDVLVADTKKPMVPGKNGYIEWLVDNDPGLPEDAKGKVDFYSYSALKNVGENDRIAVLHPPKQGTAGLSVQGQVLSAPPPKEVVYIAGENVEFRPDTGEFFALKAGRIDVRSNIIHVSRVYEVEGDVDFSVGNLKFDGFIRVRGNVQDNFHVSATEGVQIDKVVEAATIDAGGSVAVIGGINCRNKGVVRCAGDLISRFLNNAEVHVRGVLKVEKEILNCKVTAGSIESPTTMVSGGELITKGNLEVREAGSGSGVRTVLQAGRDIFSEKALDEEENRIRLDKELADGLLARVDAVEGIKGKIDKRFSDAIDALKKRATAIKSTVDARSIEVENKRKNLFDLSAQVIVHKTVQPGVVIRIGKYEKALNQQYDGFRRFTFDPKKYEIIQNFQ